MSFINYYLKGPVSRLPCDVPRDVPRDVKHRLSKIEAGITEKINGFLEFEDVIKDYAPRIVDLLDALRRHFEEWKLSVTQIVSTFKFVINISIEVGQIVEQIEYAIITDNMTKEEKYRKKIEFGQEFTYFIWAIIDPLKDQYNWIPFKRTLEEMIVKWLAAMALTATMDLLMANKTVSSLGMGKNYIRALI